MFNKRALIVGHPKCQLGVHPLDLLNLLADICRSLDGVGFRLLDNGQRDAVLAHQAGVGPSLTACIPDYRDVRESHLLPAGCWDWQEAERIEAFDRPHAADGVFGRALLCDTRREV